MILPGIVNYGRLENMLIAHGPLGYIIAEATKRFWKSGIITQRRTRWVLLVGLIGGMFPDIDLFFFYLIDASQSHRQLITHSLLIYSAVSLLGITVLRFTRFKYAGALLFAFGVGTMSHVLTDMIVGMTVWLAPITFQLAGLMSFEWYRESIFIRYSHVTGIGIELLIIACALYIWIRQYRPVWLKLYLITASVVVGIGFISLWYMNEHVYKADGFFYYGDYDNDGTLNYDDRDIDGDALLNIEDTDIDNDTEDNSLDFYLETFSMHGSLYDYTHGGIIEIPLRLGFVTPSELVKRSYANVGIFFNREMTEDYQIDSTGYEFTPTDNKFGSSIRNWQQWLSNINALYPPTAQLNEYDIVFFQSGHVGLLTRIDGVDHVLEADTSHLHTTEVPLQEVIDREGELIAIGRVLPKPPNKQY